MASSLGYTTLDGSKAKPTDNFHLINNGHHSVMHKYLLLLEGYRQEIEPSKDGTTELSLLDINFLENVLKIKTKISLLTEEHKHIVNEIFDIDKEIADLEKTKKNYDEIVTIVDKYVENYKTGLIEKAKRDNAQESLHYSPDVLNPTLPDPKLPIINTILYDKKMLLEKYETKKSQLVNEIKILKNIICTSSDISQKEENTLMCFICRDKPVDCCLNPCGHTCCNNCASRLANQQCYICRTRFTSKTKMFFDNGEIV
jgi:hypothetical protein